jgi:hypothetical protein
MIRIRILASVLWITDPYPYPDLALLCSGFLDAANKNGFFLSFFLLISYCRYINISLPRKHIIERSKDPEPDPYK